ncbi:MAG TPA: 2-oxo acid dehydrogenase subunit E2 [Terriglobia bacterium]|nr:2-oxo acid dehydrogenase subunit E2 [Terriglobia bacterium]
MPTEFKLPELGENIEKGDLVKVLVSVGDTITKDQSVLELETDKATVEVPSPVGGVVKQIHVKAGDEIKVGQLILTVDDDAAAQPSPEAKPAEAAAPPVQRADAKAPPSTKEARPAEKPAGRNEPTAAVAAPAPPASSAQTVQRGQVVEFALPPRTPIEKTPEAAPVMVPAAPSVRRMARELGVDITQVPGSGPGGRISTEDVTGRVRSMVAGAATTAPPLPDFTKWGEVDRQPMSNIRRKTAEHLSYAWSIIPRVTQYDVADITSLVDLRKAHGKGVEAAGGKLTVTAIALKVVASALKVFPQFGASVDAAKNEIVYKKYCHIGVAVDTDRGLLVPVVRNVDRKNIRVLAVELAQLAEKARTKKLTLDEMQGGVFSISNLGGIGGTGFSPVVNWPEVAILGISHARTEPVFTDGQFVPRLMLPLSLSYDHRLIDGADAARFLRWVAEALEQPFLLALQG